MSHPCNIAVTVTDEAQRDFLLQHVVSMESNDDESCIKLRFSNGSYSRWIKVGDGDHITTVDFSDIIQKGKRP